MEGAAMLNVALKPWCFLRWSHKEITNPSSATVTVPAEGPKSRTAVKTNVSETEIVAGTDGILTVIEPLRTVRRTRISQLGGMPAVHRSTSECAMTAPPHITTARTYQLPCRERVEFGTVKSPRVDQSAGIPLALIGLATPHD
jgi:hypothetical protein